MADKPNDKREDEIRVVEEPEVEVVRLDVEKIKPLEKKGKIDGRLVASPVEGEGSAEAQKQTFDPEAEWLEDEDRKGKLEVPIGWFVLLGAGLLGVLIWVFFQGKSRQDDAGELEANSDAMELAEEGITTVSTPEVKEAEAEEHFAEMEAVVANFFAAKTVEEKAKFVRHPKRVLPLMKKYYETHELESMTFKDTGEYHIVALLNRPFIALKVDLEGSEGVAVLLEDLPEGILVDWESYVCYQSIDPKQFIAERSLESQKLRVYAERDEFFTYEFANEDEYDCYRLTFRDSQEIMYGFVKKGEVTAQKFNSIFPGGSGQTSMSRPRGSVRSSGARAKVKMPVILKVRFLEGGKATRSVLIEDLEARLWAYPIDPDELERSNR